GFGCAIFVMMRPRRRFIAKPANLILGLIMAVGFILSLWLNFSSNVSPWWHSNSATVLLVLCLSNLLNIVGGQENGQASEIVTASLPQRNAREASV
ncbi:MAG: hypothetical protein M3N19_03185, partial [Candidatus Eremiobacteraeota bacterium]|nr:hypothetical protein [Candidatus Eremiobacteraeota bacterium]